ncbi:hypothetical protein ACFX2I_023997 [Malus domestica]
MSVLPAILGVDIGTILNKALGDVDPAVERGDEERSAVVVVAGMDKGLILFEELANSDNVVVVGVLEYDGCAADSGLLLLLVLVGRENTPAT